MEQHVEFLNGQKMPLLGLGTWKAESFPEFEQWMNDAFDAGYRHFDTAYCYGNEDAMGYVLKKWLEAGKVKREELFIVSKLPPNGMDESRVEHFLKLSLAAMNLDYVDLYLFHMPIGFKYIDDVTSFPKEKDSDNFAIDMTTDLIKVWKALEVQVEAGRTRSIGFSNVNDSQIERIVAAAKIKPMNVQVETHVYCQQKSLRATCAKHGITFCAYSPIGCPGRPQLFKEMGFGEIPETDVLKDSVVSAIAQSHGKSNAQIALRFLAQQNIVVIPRSTNKKRIVENSQIFDFSLTASEMNELDKLDRGSAGRIVNLSATFKGAKEHPECPY